MEKLKKLYDAQITAGLDYFYAVEQKVKSYGCASIRIEPVEMLTLYGGRPVCISFDKIKYTLHCDANGGYVELHVCKINDKVVKGSVWCPTNLFYKDRLDIVYKNIIWPSGIQVKITNDPCKVYNNKELLPIEDFIKHYKETLNEVEDEYLIKWLDKIDRTRAANHVANAWGVDITFVNPNERSIKDARYARCYEQKHFFLTTNFSRLMASNIPKDDKVYDIVSMSYNFLDGLGDSDIIEWNEEDTMRAFIFFVNQNYQDYVEED